MPAPKKKIASITVPCRGNDATKKALRQLAEQKGEFQGDLVFNALFHTYGDEFLKLIAFFAAENGSSENHSTSSKTDASESGVQ